MKLVNGEVIPGKRIGNYWIGLNKEDIIDDLESACEVREREDGFSIYTFENFSLWFETNGELVQIGVREGFSGNYKTISIGSTMKDVEKIFGGYEEDGDQYLITGLEGICFELGDLDDRDDWNELEAPIEWILVYKC